MRLPGTGPNGAWTDDDANLPKRFRTVLSESVAYDEVADVSRNLAAQRIEPLQPHLQGIERLYVAAVNAMSGVPAEALTDRFTISYTPSGTQLVQLRKQPRPSGKPTLLALGDPDFDEPAGTENAHSAPKTLPPGGLLILQVTPQGNAAQAGIAAGDVLLEYAGTELSSATQLGQLVAAHTEDESVAALVWRESEETPAERQVGAGKLGIVLARAPAPEAIARRRESDLFLASVSRGQSWQELPGTRIEIADLAKLFPQEDVTLLADSAASEQQLDALRASGELAQFRYLHFASHGQMNLKRAFESALILSHDGHSTVDDIAASKEFYDGRLTANEILQGWKLSAELVTLSACESGLGRIGGGEGFLGFTQALLLAGARSVCLSLWKMDDTATALLMSRFYQNLLGKRPGLDKPMPKAEALAEAKNWLRNLTVEEVTKLTADLSNGVARGAGRKALPLLPPVAETKEGDVHPYAHPHYWAAFVLIGDPE